MIIKTRRQDVYHAGKDACTILVGKREGKRTLGRPGRRWENDVTEMFRGFPESLQENTAMVPRFSHDRLLPDPVQFIVRL
jgi:hypothetical protein